MPIVKVANRSKIQVLVGFETLRAYEIKTISVPEERMYELEELAKRGVIVIQEIAVVASTDDFFKLVPGLLKAAGQKRGDRE